MESMGVHIFLALVFAYFLGSIPSATWIARIFYRVDITKIGSKNPGMTNVLRTLGWKPTLPVILMDAGKGYLSAFVGMHLTQNLNWALAAGLLAVLGHSFTLFAHFKGGKGVLTGFAVFLYFVPIGALSGLAAWILVVWLTRYVSLGSITAAIVMPSVIFITALFKQDHSLIPIFLVSLLVSSFVLYRHRENMSRLLKGTENKFGRATVAGNVGDTQSEAP